jgi:hypothetical protein
MGGSYESPGSNPGRRTGPHTVQRLTACVLYVRELRRQRDAVRPDVSMDSRTDSKSPYVSITGILADSEDCPSGYW